MLAAHGDGRVDCRTNEADGAFACVIDGPPGAYAFPVARTFDGRLCNPGTGTCSDVHHARGDVLRVTFIRGRVLVGHAR